MNLNDLNAITLRMIADLKRRCEAAELRAEIAEAKLAAATPDLSGVIAAIEALRADLATGKADPVNLEPVLAAVKARTGPSKIEFDLHRDGADVVRRITANIVH